MSATRRSSARSALVFARACPNISVRGKTYCRPQTKIFNNSVPRVLSTGAEGGRNCYRSSTNSFTATSAKVNMLIIGATLCLFSPGGLQTGNLLFADFRATSLWPSTPQRVLHIAARLSLAGQYGAHIYSLFSWDRFKTQTKQLGQPH